ncbi:MAG: hypothetical protein SF029_21285 [bacterium]|nr:hypothetical protein [bacterium]
MNVVIGMCAALLAIAACSPVATPTPISTRQLGQAATDTPTPVPTDLRSAEPASSVSPEATRSTEAVTPGTPVPTLEVNSPLQVATVEADFVLVTPTLPPSKTTTATPTLTQTLTLTPTITPTITVTATATIPQFPTSVVTPVPAVVAQPQNIVCQSTWFFMNPRPESCPLAPPTASGGVYQTFQNGFMIWLGHLDVIYVFYNDSVQPRWQMFPDAFSEGMVEEDPAFRQSPFPNTWQPRRGFGMLWRGNTAVRERIGWATLEWEQPYSLQSQTSPDGTLFISDPSGGVFAAIPGGSNWTRYTALAGN